MSHVYALVDSGDPETYHYIGKTTLQIEARLYGHMIGRKYDKNLHKVRWMAQVIDAGREVLILSIEECPSENLDGREIYWIAKALADGHPLTNLTAGGEGGVNPSPEVREKIANALRGRKRPAHVVEAVRLSASQRTGERNPNFGNRWSQEQRNHLSAIKREQYKGSGNPQSKLTDDQVRGIFAERLTGRTQISIAKQYGVCEGSVQNITKGRSWKHLRLIEG